MKDMREKHLQAGSTLMLLALLIGAGCSQETALAPDLAASGGGSLKAAVSADSPWELAQTDQVTSGSSFDMLSRRAAGVDDLGTVHAIYQRGVSAEQVLYYTAKRQGGEWSEPEVLGPAGTYPGTGWLEVRRETGEAYVVFFESHDLKLGIRDEGGWRFHTLTTPAEYGVGKPAMTVAADGTAHIAMLVNYDDPPGYVNWRIAYGYWDGSDDFHFQLLDKSYVPHHGLFAQPDLVVRPDGRVAISHHHGQDGRYVILVQENDVLGGTLWSTEAVDLRTSMPFPESLEIDQFGHLHLAFHTNIELGAEHHVFYSVRKDSRFSRPTEVSGDITGARPRLALTPAGDPHFVFEETLGPSATGRLIHAFSARGKWRQEAVVDQEAFAPSFFLDRAGNGSLLYERRIIHMENNNIKYFGYVAP